MLFFVHYKLGEKRSPVPTTGQRPWRWTGLRKVARKVERMGEKENKALEEKAGGPQEDMALEEDEDLEEEKARAKARRASQKERPRPVARKEKVEKAKLIHNNVEFAMNMVIGPENVQTGCR